MIVQVLRGLDGAAKPTHLQPVRSMGFAAQIES